LAAAELAQIGESVVEVAERIDALAAALDRDLLLDRATCTRPASGATRAGVKADAGSRGRRDDLPSLQVSATTPGLSQVGGRPLRAAVRRSCARSRRRRRLPA